MPKLYPAAKLAEVEWLALAHAFANSIYLSELEKFRTLGNVPQRACDIFGVGGAYHFDEGMNAIMNAAIQPFRVKQVEACGASLRDRGKRKVAIVRWTAGRQLKLPLGVVTSKKKKTVA